jgi:chromosome segregation ATPase
MDALWTDRGAVFFPAGLVRSNANPLQVTMDTVVSRPAGGARPAVWPLVLAAFFVGAVGASVLFVGVWRNEASRARSADSEASKSAEVLSATTAKLGRAEARLRIVERKLRAAQANTKEQAGVLKQFAAAGSPVTDDAAQLDSAAQQLVSDGSGLGDSLAKLTNAVAALGVYLEQTSVSELDPAYLDAQLSYLQQALAGLESRTERLKSGAGSVEAARKALAAHVSELERLASRAPAGRP